MKPLLSVFTITYNHAPFIRQCIEGVLMQKTDFPFEFVIGEDCSTDGTREIVLDYAKKNPEIIRVITSESNVGMSENAKRTGRACQGKFVALCDGDDYWTDPYKLQKQVDFLESHPDYSMCCHASKIIFEDSEQQAEVVRLADTDTTFTIDDFLAPTGKNFIRTESVVCNVELVREVPEEFQNMIVGDYPMFLLMAYHGNIRYLDQVMSVYRKHGGGIWSSKTTNAEFQEKYCLSIVQMHKRFDEYSGYVYHDKIQKRLAYSYYALIENSFNYNKAQSRKFFWKYWNKLPGHFLIRSFSRLYLKPSLHWVRVHISGRG